MSKKQATLEHGICGCQPWGRVGTKGPRMKTRWSLPPGNLGEQGRPFFQSSESKCQDVRQEAENGPCGSKETQSSNPLRDPPHPTFLGERSGESASWASVRKLKPKLRCAF